MQQILVHTESTGDIHGRTKYEVFTSSIQNNDYQHLCDMNNSGGKADDAMQFRTKERGSQIERALHEHDVSALELHACSTRP